MSSGDANVSPALKVIKTEPQDPPPLVPIHTAPVLVSPDTQPTSPVKAAPLAQSPPHGTHNYKTYRAADEIDYTPESALTEGINIANALGAHLAQLDLGTDLRKNVWLREIESLKRQGFPRTMIAVCGATGAGKSSLLNAVLDDNIVPTSGMRACTAVVTEIGHHDKDTIVAEVEFLALSEWKAELEILLDDLVGEDGRPKRSTDLRNDAGVAWHKMHAVYPDLDAEHLVKMKPDDIINSNPQIAQIFDTTEVVECPDSEQFGQAIAKFIDSKDQKSARGRPGQKEKSKPTEPALWPLIRVVRIRVKAQALSSGALLVDLPGVADANLARSSIAKEYMKKCNCVWITAPIARAVDDKTAKDLLGEAFQTQPMNGNYNASVVTFIATRTDDISCAEVIGALGLEREPDMELAKIEAELDKTFLVVNGWTTTLEEVGEKIHEVTKEIETLRALINEDKDCLKMLEGGPTSSSSKRQRQEFDSRQAKRARPDNEGYPILLDTYGKVLLDLNYNGPKSNESNNVEREDIVKSILKLDGGVGIVPNGAVQVDLWEHIEEKESKMRSLNTIFFKLMHDRSNAISNINEHNQVLSVLQLNKKAYCAKERNEYSKKILKEDFREGLREFKQVEAEARDPENFDPNKYQHNYSTVAIDLPVFTCSSCDYMLIKKQVKGDGGPICFTKLEDTEIPALQEWCHKLTLTAREQSALSLLNNISSFLHSIQSYLEAQGGNMMGRATLAEKWGSDTHKAGSTHILGLTQAQINPPPPPDTPPKPLYGRRRRKRSTTPPPDLSLNTLVKRVRQPLGKKPRDCKGFSALLRQDLRKVTNDCVRELRRVFRNGIQKRCDVGANKAKQAAVDTSDSFARRLSWQGYRAALRRFGEWQVNDLNAELVRPMSREIATPWARLFDSNLFASTEKAAIVKIVQLLQQVEDSAPQSLGNQCKVQCQVARRETQVLLGNIFQNLKSVMTDEQKRISRSLIPHVQSKLKATYNEALEEHGPGSVARQKALLHGFVDESRGVIFSSATTTLLTQLDEAAKLIGELLEEAFGELTDKIEVTTSILWDIPNDDKEEIMKRHEFNKQIQAMSDQIKLWSVAGKASSHGNVTKMEYEYDLGDDVEHSEAS